MEFIEFETQVPNLNTKHCSSIITNKKLISDFPDKSKKVFSRRISEKVYTKSYSRGIKELIIDCDVPVPNWFYEHLDGNIRRFRLCPDYPRDDIAHMADEISKITDSKLLIIMINKETDVVDFNFGYTPANVKIEGQDKSRIKILNAPHISNLILCGKIHVQIERCLGIKKIHGEKDFPTLEYIGDCSRRLKKIIGNFNKILGLNITTLDKNLCRHMQSVPKNKLNIIPFIRRNQTHIEGIPKYKDLLGYKKLVIYVENEPIDLSSFEMSSLDLLEIRGEIGSNRLVLPKIEVIDRLVIDCCKIKNTYFGYVGKINDIRIENPYAICMNQEIPTYRRFYGWYYTNTFITIPDFLVNLLPFCEINCIPLHDTEFRHLLNENGSMSKDKYIDFLEHQPREPKSASNT